MDESTLKTLRANCLEMEGFSDAGIDTITDAIYVDHHARASSVMTINVRP